MEIANDPNNWGTVSYKTLPSYLQEALELQSAGNLPKTQLHLQARSGVHDVVLVPETFSPEMLTSFHCHIHGKAMGVWSARAIGRFLAKAVNLKSLDLVVNRQDMSPSERWLLLISRDENENRRLPAIEKLRLVQYDWSQHPDYFPRLWDFSNLKSLELRGVQIENFLSGVPFEMLSGLEELSITDRVYSIPIRPAGSTVPDFKSELWPHLKKLQSLEIGMWWSRYLDLKTLVLFPRLRKLNLSLFGLYRKPYAHQPILSLEDLEFVLATLPELRVLGLAMDIQVNLEQAVSLPFPIPPFQSHEILISHSSQNEFLAGICKFRDLISLRLDISMGSETTFVRTEDSYLLFPPPRSRDDDVYGHKIIQYLVTCKQGVAFEEIMVVDRHGADRIPFYRYEKERGESLRFKAGIGGYDNRDVQASVPTANVNGIEEKVVIEGRSEVSAGIS